MGKVPGGEYRFIWGVGFRSMFHEIIDHMLRLGKS